MSNPPDIFESLLQAFFRAMEGISEQKGRTDDPEPGETLSEPPEPFTQPVIHCPNCGHGIDPHKGWREACGVGGDNGACGCMWTPNDIAATLLERTADSDAQVATEEVPRGPWWDAAEQWYRVWAHDYPQRAREPLPAVLELLSVIAFDDGSLPLAEAAARLVLVIDGAPLGRAIWRDPAVNEQWSVWNNLDYVANEPLKALMAALGSDPFGNGKIALQRVRNTASLWLQIIERGEDQ